MDRNISDKTSKSDGTDWYSIIDKKKYYNLKEALAITGIGESVIVMAKYQGHLKTKPGKRKRSWVVLGSDLISWDRSREKKKKNTGISSNKQIKDEKNPQSIIKEDKNPDNWYSIIDLNRYYSNKELPEITRISENRLFRAKYNGKLKSKPGARKRSWLVLGSDLISWHKSFENPYENNVDELIEIDEVEPSGEISVILSIIDYDKLIEDVHDIAVINERKEFGIISLEDLNITKNAVANEGKIFCRTSIRKDFSKIPLDYIPLILNSVYSLNINRIISEGTKIGDSITFYRVKLDEYKLIFELYQDKNDFFLLYIRKRDEPFFGIYSSIND